MPRDGYQGWSRAKEDAWERAFLTGTEPPRPQGLITDAHTAKRNPFEKADPKTVMATLHAKKCYPPCDDCKCVKP
jgi:hypothetical protein